MEIFWLEDKLIKLFPNSAAYIIHGYRQSVFADLCWHGVITFYEKHVGIRSDLLSVKVGCDYNHLRDEGIEYTLEMVQEDLTTTVYDFLFRYEVKTLL